jgi:hypothetical protein
MDRLFLSRCFEKLELPCSLVPFSFSGNSVPRHKSMRRALSVKDRWMDSRAAATLVISAGVIAIVVGLLILAGGLNWFGTLPGDIRIERENTRIYFPITSMILISLVLNLVFFIARRLY